MTDYWTYNRLKMPKLVPKIPIGWMSIVAMSKRLLRHPADYYVIFLMCLI